MDEDETLQPVDTCHGKLTACKPMAQNVMTADTECGIIVIIILLLYNIKFMLYTDKCKNRISAYLTLDKRNEQLKKKDKDIIDLKEKLKEKEQECGII